MSTIVSLVKQARKTAELEIKILRNGVEVPPEEWGKSSEKLKAELLSSNVAAISGITSPLAGMVDSLRKLSETSKILTLPPEILTPKSNYGVVEQGLAKLISGNLGIINDEIERQRVTRDVLTKGILGGISTWDEQMRNAAVAGLSRTNDSIREALSAAALAGADSIIQTTTNRMDLFRQAIFSVNTTLYEPFNIFRKLEDINKRFRNALLILEVDPDDPEEYYRDAPLDALEQEASVVSWMKERAMQGRLQAERATLEKYLKTGQITGYTFGRFMHLIMSESPQARPSAEYWIPSTNEFELQIQLDPALPPHRLIYPVAPGQTPVVRVLATGASNQHQGNAVSKQLSQPILLDDDLTEREKEVARLLAQGQNDKQIADKLCISAGTAKKHRQHIKPKWEMDTEDERAMQAEAKRRGYGQG